MARAVLVASPEEAMGAITQGQPSAPLEKADSIRVGAGSRAAATACGLAAYERAFMG